MSGGGDNPGMGFFRSLLRILFLLAGAVLGLVLFLVAVLTFVVFMLVRLLTGRKPDLEFRVNKNPWAARRAPAGEVVDVEAREVGNAGEAPPPSLPGPGHQDLR